MTHYYAQIDVSSPNEHVESILPLGILSTIDLSSDQLTRLKKLENYDLWFIKERIEKKNLIDFDLVELAMFEFRRFIALRIISGRGLAMFSPQVDEVWHTFILFTKDYSSFCEEVCGEFIHHNPRTSRSVHGEGETFEVFSALYSQVYGNISPLWIPKKDCNDGGSICQCDGCDVIGHKKSAATTTADCTGDGADCHDCTVH